MLAVHQIAQYLQDRNIEYQELNHDPVMTVDESVSLGVHTKSAPSKTLFLTNKKHSEYFIVVMPGFERLDMKRLAKELSESKLTFASNEELKQHLNTYPGAVSPLGAIFIKSLNKELIKMVVYGKVIKSEFVGFHPNDNSKTFEFKKDEFSKFINSLEIETIFLP